MAEKRLEIVIDPTRAKGGGRIVRRQIKGIGDEAVKTQRRVDRMAGKSGRSLDKFGRSAKSARGAAAGLSGAATGTARSLGMTNVAAGMAATGFAALATAAAAAAVAFASVAVSASLALDRALTEVATLSKNAKDNIGQLKDEARAMAREFGGSAVSQVRGFYEAISAGAGTVKQAAVLLRDANKLAKAGVTTVLDGVNILSTVLNAYGRDMLTATQASDALFTAVKVGRTTVPQLAANLGNVLPISKSLGISFDETAGAVAALTSIIPTTSQSVTALKAIMQAVISPTMQARKQAHELGLAFNSTALKTKKLKGFLEDVIKETKGSKEAIAKLFGSIEAIGGVLAFAGGAGEKFNTVMDKMSTKFNAVEAGAKTVAESLSDRYDVALAKISDRLIDLGDRLLPLVVGALEGIANGVDFVANKFTDGMDRMEADATFAKDVISAAFTDIPSAIAVSVIATIDSMVNYVKKGLNEILAPVNKVIAAADMASRSFGGKGFSQIERFNDKGTVFGDYEGGDLSKKAVTAYKDAVKKRQQAYTIIEMRGKKFGGLDETYSNRKSGPKPETEETGRNTRSLLGNSKARKTVISDYQKQRNAAKSATDGLRQETQSLADQQTALGMGEQAATAFLKAKQVIAGLTRDGKTLLTHETKAIYEQAKGYAAQAASLKVVQDGIAAFKRSVEFAKDTTKSFVSDFRQGLQSGEGFWKSFANAGLNAMDKIATRLTDMAIDNLFANAFGGKQGGSGGGNFLSSIFGSVFGGGSKAAPSWNPMMGFANGGISNRPAIFGEAGPEAAVPLPDGRRIPVDLRGFQVPKISAPANNNQPQRIDVHVTVSGELVEKDGGIVGLVTQVASQAVKQATPGIVGQSVKMVSARVRAGGSL